METSQKEWEFTPKPVGYRFEEAVVETFDGIRVKSANVSYKKPVRSSNNKKTLMLLIERVDSQGRPRLDYYFMDEGDRLLQLADGSIALVKDLSLIA